MNFPPTKEQLRELAKEDAILNNIFQLQELADWSLEDSLSYAVALMVEDRKRLVKELVRLHSEWNAPRIFMPPKTGEGS